MKFSKRSKHDKILIVTAWIVAMIMLISACLVDSENWEVFWAITTVCAVYLGLFTYANADRGGIL